MVRHERSLRKKKDPKRTKEMHGGQPATVTHRGIACAVGVLAALSSVSRAAGLARVVLAAQGRDLRCGPRVHPVFLAELIPARVIDGIPAAAAVYLGAGLAIGNEELSEGWYLMLARVRPSIALR